MVKISKNSGLNLHLPTQAHIGKAIPLPPSSHFSLDFHAF